MYIEDKKKVITWLSIGLGVLFVISSFVFADNGDIHEGGVSIFTFLYYYFFSFFVSIKFLPEWLSATVLLLGLAVRILDFIVITKYSPNEKNHYKSRYTKKHKIVNIAGIITLPVWFWFLAFFAFEYTGVSNSIFAFVFQIYLYISLAIAITVFTLVMDLQAIGVEIPVKATVIIITLCIIVNFLSFSVVDFLRFGTDYKKDIIDHNIDSIEMGMNCDVNGFNYEGGDEVSLHSIKVNYEKTISSMKSYPGVIIMDFTFTNSYGEELWISLTGFRYFFGEYKWTIRGELSDYWQKNQTNYDYEQITNT